jgi:TolA-binding protein
MNKRIVILAMPLILAGCPLLTRNDMEQAEQKKSMQDQVVTLQKNTADQQSKFNEINDELRELSGRIEVLENRLNTNSADKNRAQSIQDEQLAETNKKVQLLQEEIGRLEGQIAALSGGEVAAKQPAGLFEQGEESFSKKDWKKAILSYQKFRDSNPKSKKFAEATFKIGMSFQELGMKEEAKTFYEEVISKFPTTPFAKAARSKLKKK